MFIKYKILSDVFLFVSFFRFVVGQMIENDQESVAAFGRNSLDLGDKWLNMMTG